MLMPLINGEFKPLQLPEKHARVIYDNSKKWRYRALYGGRNGGKDWSFAAALIERCILINTRALCTREIQDTLKDSIHQLLSDTIDRLGYTRFFRVTDKSIDCPRTGSKILFRGLRDLNADNIKSIEGVDVCLIGEAQYLTKESWNILDPSIRGKDHQEIWIQFNPKFEDDFVYEMCVINPPDNMIADLVNYTENPWTSDETYKMAERMRLQEPDLYRNIWMGEPLGQGGRVFPMFDPDVHIIDFDYSWLEECNLYMSIDPHRKYYPAIGWHAVTPTNMVITYNEWPRYADLDMWYDEARNVKQFEMSLEKLSNIILSQDMTIQYGGRVLARVTDPRFNRENPDFVGELVRHGVTGWTEAPFERIETQRENLKSLINYNPAIPIGGINQPEYYVDRKCTNHERALRRHCWDPDKDKESEEHKDFIDGLRYFLSIVDGRPVHVPNPSKKINSSEQLISPAAHSVQNLPATGYNH
jgi:hypothetical protein